MSTLADRITTQSAKVMESGTSGDSGPQAAQASKDLEYAQMDGSSEMRGGSTLQDEGNEEVEVKLSDMQADPNSPLYSVQSFEELGLDEQILKGIYSMRWIKPSRIQERALPLLLGNPPQNMIAQSQSGTGKTGTFVLTMLSRIDITKNKPQALCLAPTRELAGQIEGVVKVMADFLKGLDVFLAVPRVTIPKRDGRPAIESQVIVGTPGTVCDLINRRYLDASSLKILVLDEADNMLKAKSLRDQCSHVKKRVRDQGGLAQETQILLFSATFPDEVMSIAHKFSPRANEIKLKREELTVAGIQQMYLDCPTDRKYACLIKLYGLMTISSSIVFVGSREDAKDLERRMRQDRHQATYLSGDLPGSERDAIIEEFRTQKIKVLIATNVLARGIDVQSVTMVINYDIPLDGDRNPDVETYLHRTGRTGRFGRVGVSISFVSDKKSYEDLKVIADSLKMDLIRIDDEDWDESETQLKRIVKANLKEDSSFKSNDR